MSAQLKTIAKCRRILQFYDDVQPRRECKKPVSRSKSKRPYSSSQQKSLRHDFSFSKNCSFNTTLSKVAYVSPYKRQSRLDKIMRLKVKPAHVKVHPKRKIVLNTSLNSSRSSNKENNATQSRFERIMKIKIMKPTVSSTLHNYMPVVYSRSVSKNSRPESATKEWKQCVNSIKRLEKQNQKEDRLWKLFERERDFREKSKQKIAQKEFSAERRKEKKFQKLVEKEIKKIEKEKQRIRRQKSGFSPYLFPSY